jgi:hypothetical protein
MTPHLRIGINSTYMSMNLDIFLYPIIYGPLICKWQ